jgi:hypothetical protein
MRPRAAVYTGWLRPELVAASYLHPSRDRPVASSLPSVYLFATSICEKCESSSELRSETIQ